MKVMADITQSKIPRSFHIHPGVDVVIGGPKRPQPKLVPVRKSEKKNTKEPNRLILRKI